jgi:hypothetical protein
VNIDFTPITNSRRYEIDRKKLEVSGKKRGFIIWLYIFLIFTVIAIPFLIFRLVVYLRQSNKEVGERRAALKEFAIKNGFTFENTEAWKPITDDKVATDLDLPYKADRVLHFDKLKGTLLGYDFAYSLSSVQKKDHKNSNSYTQWPTTLFVVDLPVQLPRVFIDSKFNNLPGLDASAVNFEQAEDHALEGDFPDYYNIRIEKDQHIDMYTILTPEVMDTLKHNYKYDVWMNGHQLVLLTFGDYPRYFAGTSEAFKNAETLMREIDKIARAVRQGYTTVA